MSIVSYIKKNIELIIFALLLSIFAYLIIRRSWDGFYTAQHGINRLDAIIYINLENRNDRKQLFMNELVKLNTNMDKVHKVCGVYIPKNGHKGCIQSHILALNMIKLNKWKRVLIMEDDAELDIPPEAVNELINETLDTLDNKNPDWNVIMLASANKVVDEKAPEYALNISTLDGPIIPIKIKKLQTATTSSAYIIKDTYVDRIINLFNNCNDNMEHGKMSSPGNEHWALDQRWADLQRKDNWFVYDKDPVKQRAIWSTIQSNA